jgi:tetratricopeptide (TPR) repeat protein
MLSRIIGSLKLAGLAVICMIGGSDLPLAQNVSERAPLQEPEAETGTHTLSQWVKQWRVAAAQHIAGKPDSPAVMIGKWTLSDCESVLSYISKLAAQPVASSKRTLAKGQIRRMLELTDQEVRQGDLNRVLKQGALLHTDIALLELGTAQPQYANDMMGVFADGRLILQSHNAHWQYARRLLDAVSLSSRDPLVRQWYIATTAYMQSRRDLGYSGRNLKSALDKFPTDARILFYAGVLHEIYASPVSQNNVLPMGWQISYGSKETELKLARQFFQKAVSTNPDFVEARLRLGRVLGLLGNHPQALAELQQVAASIKDSQLLYYTSLYLGYELEMQSRRDEAREQYERAANLYPAAQSPLLALSQLARSGDDVSSALLHLQGVFALKAKDLWKDDPWWIYDLAHVRNAAALVTEMHRMFGALSR